MKQETFYRGIYEFEDPSGGLIAAKVPASGSVDLYDGTAVVVRPNQRAILVYKGKIAEILTPGTHEIKTENVPVLTQLANWKFGFKSPLRCELWFFMGNVHTSRKWGTKNPVLSQFDEVGTIPIRAFGTYNVKAMSPKKIFNGLVGSRTALDISEVEEFVQSQLIENLSQALQKIKEVKDLSRNQDDVSKDLERIVNKVLKPYGIKVKDIQIQSLLPPKEVMEAIDTKVAMDIIGDPKKFLLYKAANSLDELRDGSSNDSMQMMMGLMMGKGLMDLESEEAPVLVKPKQIAASKKKFCTQCGQGLSVGHKFCFNCGAKA